MAINLKRVASALLSAVTGAALMASARSEVVQRQERCSDFDQYPLARRDVACTMKAMVPYDF